MEGIMEVVKVVFNQGQNLALEATLRDFYKLGERFPRLSKTIFVDKDSYTKFLRKNMRERTPYQADRPFSSMAFSETKLPFLVSYSILEAKFPSGRTITLTEHLTEPNGLTKSVHLTDSAGESASFDRYLHAEAEMLERFLGETK